jgi:hypothetical protein
MMSFIQLPGLNDTRELPYAKEGRYPLVITSAKVKDTNDGKGQNIMVVLDIEDSEKYQAIFHYIPLPRNDDATKDQNRLLGAKRFFHQFGVSMDNGINLEDLPGARGEGNLGVDEFEGQIRNVLKVDRLPTEG